MGDAIEDLIVSRVVEESPGSLVVSGPQEKLDLHVFFRDKPELCVWSCVEEMVSNHILVGGYIVPSVAARYFDADSNTVSDEGVCNSLPNDRVFDILQGLALIAWLINEWQNNAQDSALSTTDPRCHRFCIKIGKEISVMSVYYCGEKEGSKAHWGIGLAQPDDSRFGYKTRWFYLEPQVAHV